MDTGTDAVAGSCTSAQTTFGVATQNTTCVACVETPAPTGCCDAYAACAVQGQCIGLLSCILNGDAGLPCSSSDCLQTCENAYSGADISAYLTLAQCVTSSCPGCPSLPY
jgi:hypothetical protein